MEKDKNNLRIAFIGMRGLPADLPKAGGGERETEAKTTRLAARGHDIVVYCRWHYNRHPESPYKKVKLISLPSIPTKNLDTVTHSLIATLHVIVFDTADIISFHGMGNAIYVLLAKLGQKKTVVYMDGVDWERPKWGIIARKMLYLAAKMAFSWSDCVYVDNIASQQAFEQIFHKTAQVITLAADIWTDPGNDLLAQFGLHPQKYILFVGLLKPDKGVHILVEAYESLKTDIPLVIVGDSPDKGDYVQRLKSTQDSRIKFLGYVYGRAAQQLFSNALIYVQPSLMEGNSPALMSAMACGRCVVTSNIPQNLETLGNAGFSFQSGDAQSLRQVLFDLLQEPSRIIQFGELALQRIDRVYNWQVVTDKLEKMYYNLGR